MLFLHKPPPRTTPPRIANLGARLESHLKTWGALGVAIFAIIYYAAYYRSGLNFSGEGGTVAIIAMRLLDGQRPIVDTFLGYNVMWFYPVAWLFQITGPDYTALRIFFFALCTVTGILAFFVVRRVTGSGWYSTLAALGPVLIPGMLFRNYMAFLPMLNMLALLQAYVFQQPTTRRQILWMAGAGAVLGLTYLMRIDLGTFFTIMTAGLIALYPFGVRRAFARRLPLAVAGTVLAVAMFCATHAPFYFDAVKRGYAEAFVAQYTTWIGMVRYLASQQLAKPTAPVSTPPEEASPVLAEPTPSPTPKLRNRDVDSDGYLQKRSMTDIVQGQTLYDRAFALATYLPRPCCSLDRYSGCNLAHLCARARRFDSQDGGSGFARYDRISPHAIPAVFLLSSGYAAPLGVHGAVPGGHGLRALDLLPLEPKASGSQDLLRLVYACLSVRCRGLFFSCVSQRIVGLHCRPKEAQIRVCRRKRCARLAEAQGTGGSGRDLSRDHDLHQTDRLCCLLPLRAHDQFHDKPTVLRIQPLCG